LIVLRRSEDESKWNIIELPKIVVAWQVDMCPALAPIACESIVFHKRYAKPLDQQNSAAGHLTSVMEMQTKQQNAGDIDRRYGEVQPARGELTFQKIASCREHEAAGLQS
jgi:hypothetical protein